MSDSPTERFDAVVAAPFGALGVRTRGEAIAELAFLPPGTPPRAASNAVAERAANALGAYLADADTRFDLPLEPQGTAFQRRVWDAISRIPPGETRTYGELAREIGSVPRAVGQACGANALPVVVPCHRVVAAGGVGGFAHSTEGFLLTVKRWLLVHESKRTPSRG
ncbi:MAG: methylated-DNA--[protein]-cysteine S-methyltransferase [Burkholderiales bacterium]